MWRAKASKGGENKQRFRNELSGEQRLVKEGKTNNSFRNELCGEQRLVREGKQTTVLEMNCVASKG